MVAIVGKDQSVYKRITCRQCGSILEYTPSEVLQRTVKDYGGGSDTYRYITCPSCCKEVTVSSW